MTMLATRLFDDALSVENERAETRSEEEWLAEIERRARAARAGSPGVSWETARAEIERRRASRR